MALLLRGGFMRWGMEMDMAMDIFLGVRLNLDGFPYYFPIFFLFLPPPFIWFSFLCIYCFSFLSILYLSSDKAALSLFDINIMKLFIQQGEYHEYEIVNSYVTDQVAIHFIKIRIYYRVRRSTL